VDVPMNPNLMTIYGGESIQSIRCLMRRACFYKTTGNNGNTTSQATGYYNTFARRPAFYGYDPNGFGTASSSLGGANYNFNFVNNTPMTYWAPCFVGERGSVNYDINFISGQNTNLDSMALSRYPYAVTRTSDVTSVSLASLATNGSAGYWGLQVNQFIGKAGMALTTQKTQAGLQVNVPMYSRFRFYSTYPLDRRLGVSNDESSIDNMMLSYKFIPLAGDNPKNTFVDFYVSAGIDYQLLFFVNVPSFWQFAIPNTV